MSFHSFVLKFYNLNQHFGQNIRRRGQMSYRFLHPLTQILFQSFFLIGAPAQRKLIRMNCSVENS